MADLVIEKLKQEIVLQEEQRKTDEDSLRREKEVNEKLRVQKEKEIKLLMTSLDVDFITDF